MKKILALLAVVLGVVSCQTEPEGLDVNVGGEQEVAICVSLPEATRTNSALGAFDNVDLSGDATIRYILKIYQKVGENYVASTDRQVEYSDGTNVVFPVRLVPNRDYRFVVWADYVESKNDTDFHYNTEDLANITLNGEWKPMDETRDAFTGYFDTEEKGKQYTSTSSINITLTRPFAKLRVITTDMKELGYLGIVPHNAAVTYTTQFHESFNAFNGQYGAETASKFHTSFEIKAYDDNVADKSKVLFTDYFFADDSDVVKFVMNVNEANGALIKSNTFNTDIAVKRNYLTTIAGNILTDGNNIKVDIVKDGAFDGEKEWPEEGDSAQELAYAAMFGGEVTLTENITLTQPLKIVEGANAVINLNGKTITGAFVKGKGAIIENNGTLTLVGGTIKNTETNGDAVINNNGELVLDGVKIEGAPIGTTNYPNYAVYTSGKLVVEEGTQIISDRGALSMVNGVDVTINGGEFIVTNAVGTRTLTAHVIYAYGRDSKLTINDGNFAMNIANGGGSSVICPAGATIKVYGGNFYHAPVSDSQSGCFQNYMGYGAPVDVYGGVFNDDTVTKSGNLADGYKAVESDGKYVVVAEEVDAVASTPAEVLSAMKVAGQTVYIVPTADGSAHKLEGKMSLAEGVKLIGMGDTPAALFNDWGSNAFANQAHFTNTHVENINFTNNLIIDAGIATGDVKFVNCVFGGDLAHQGVHFDSGNGTITFENCTFVGRNMFGSSLENVIFNNCTFLNKKSSLTGADKWTGVNMWGKYEFNNCTFDTEAHCNVKCDGVVAKFNNCKYVDNRDIKTIINNGPHYTADIKFDGYKYVAEGLLLNEATGEHIACTEAGLQAAISSGATTIMLSEGTYVIPDSASGKTITFVGTGAPEDTLITAQDDGAAEGNCDYSLRGSKATFENVTITTTRTYYPGYAGCQGTYKNCIINGVFTLYESSSFEDCTFNISGDLYNVWTWGAAEATFTKCTFNCDGKAMLLYGGANTKLTVNNCTFNDNGGLVDELKAAIEIGNDYNMSYELIVNNTIVNGFAINNKGINTGTNLWANKNSMPQDKLNVIVDGVDVY